jgi:hypothetical protein
VKNVNRPNGTVLWVFLDLRAIGLITLDGGAGTMKTYNDDRVRRLLRLSRRSAAQWLS